MKANETPEKIYIFENPILDFTKLSIRQSSDDVEYTRTDAFIEKAAKYIKDHLFDYWSLQVPNESEFIKDFEEYLKK